MNRGISGGEKRRVSIASELVTDPHILFLDEPTSGLDSTSSYALIQTLVNLSRKNRTIITTIHQPNSNMYSLFDNVMLLARGETIYNGPANRAVQYFADQGHPCPPLYNPADFMLDLVSINSSEVITQLAERHRAEYRSGYGLSPHGAAHRSSLQADVDDEEAGDVPSEKSFLIRTTPSRSVPHNSDREELKSEYAAYWFDQVGVLAKRTMLNNLRSPALFRLQYLMSIVLGLLCGFIYFKAALDLRGAQDRLGALFFMSALISFTSLSSIDLFFHDRSIFVRERATGMYSTSAYFLVRAFCDIIPMRVIPAIILGVIPYYMITFHSGWNHLLILISVLVLLSVVSTSLCFLVSTVAPNVSFANLVMVIVLLFNMLFGGFLVNKGTLPLYINWMKYTSFLSYGFEILCCNEFLGYFMEFNPVGIPDVAPMTGQQWITQFDMDASNIPRDYYALGAMSLAQLFGAYLFLRFYIKERR